MLGCIVIFDSKELPQKVRLNSLGESPNRQEANYLAVFLELLK